MVVDGGCVIVSSKPFIAWARGGGVAIPRGGWNLAELGGRPLSRIFLKSLSGLGKIRLKLRLAIFFSAEFRLTYLRLIFRLIEWFFNDAHHSMCRCVRMHRHLHLLCLTVLLFVHHRLNGSSSPVLTATCFSYGSLCDFLGFFPQPTWRSHPSTDFDKKWLKRRGFTNTCASWSTNRNFL